MTWLLTCPDLFQGSRRVLAIFYHNSVFFFSLKCGFPNYISFRLSPQKLDSQGLFI